MTDKWLRVEKREQQGKIMEIMRRKVDDLTNPIGKFFHHQRHNGRNDGIEGNLF